MRSLARKILTIIIGAGIYCVLERFVGISTSLDGVRITYAQHFIIWVSVLTGPVIGGITGGIGEALSQIGLPSLDWITVFCTVLNCVAIGYFTRNLDVNNGFCNRNDIFYFEKVQMISNFLVWEIPYTALNVLVCREKIAIALYRGFWISLNNSISCMLLTSLFLSLYAKTRMSAANFYRD